MYHPHCNPWLTRYVQKYAWFASIVLKYGSRCKWGTQIGGIRNDRFGRYVSVKIWLRVQCFALEFDFARPTLPPTKTTPTVIAPINDIRQIFQMSIQEDTVLPLSESRTPYLNCITNIVWLDGSLCMEPRFGRDWHSGGNVLVNVISHYIFCPDRCMDCV